jgi:hypothetical protein
LLVNGLTQAGKEKEAMFQSFAIKNFRCFSSLLLQPLARVNLIAGKNNTGREMGTFRVSFETEMVVPQAPSLHAMPSRGLTFHQEIQDAVAARERLVLVVGPKAALSDYVRQEWQFALQADKAATPILRQGDYPSQCHFERDNSK